MGIEELRAERVRCGFSQVKFAELIGCNVHSYRKKEAGNVAFSVYEMAAIARVLNLTVEKFNAIFFNGELPFGK